VAVAPAVLRAGFPECPVSRCPAGRRAVLRAGFPGCPVLPCPASRRAVEARAALRAGFPECPVPRCRLLVPVRCLPVVRVECPVGLPIWVCLVLVVLPIWVCLVLAVLPERLATACNLRAPTRSHLRWPASAVNRLVRQVAVGLPSAELLVSPASRVAGAEPRSRAT
jgi:hypothetical protein